MADALNVQRVLLPPFSSKPLMLRLVADGAIPLLSVNSVKRMTVFAMRLLRVNIRDRCAVPLSILGSRYHVEVLGIDAASIPARVVDDHTGRKIAVHREPSDPMCPSTLPAKEEGAVSILIERPRPDMTAGMECQFPFGIEPLKLGFCKMHFVLPFNGVQGIPRCAG